MDHVYNYHPDSYMGASGDFNEEKEVYAPAFSQDQVVNTGLGDIWSDLRDKFNLPDTNTALDILKKDGVTGLQSAVASGVVSSETANQLMKETAEKQGTQALADNLRQNWKTYLVVGGVVALAGAGLMFLIGRGSK